MTQLGALVFARCLGLVIRAPGFSHPSVPVPLRGALAFVLALGLVPALGAVPVQHPVSMIAALVFEVAIGGAIGFGASILYEGASAGGKLLDDYVGIQVSNPSAQAGEGQAFQQLWGLGFIAAFFMLDGYQYVLMALTDSLKAIPPGSLAAHGAAAFAMQVPLLVVKAALLVAGPALVLGLTANIAVGAITRMIPRFNNFQLTFPIVFMTILLTTLVTLRTVLPHGGQPWLPLPFTK